MIYAYFGGLGADKRARFECVLEQSRVGYTVTQYYYPRHNEQQQPPEGIAGRVLHWMSIPMPITTHLYRGYNADSALSILFRTAREANRFYAGQRFCYVLPTVPEQPNALAVLIPAMRRFDGRLPAHAQLWQVGQSLATLPRERHSQVVGAIRVRGDGPLQYGGI